MKSRASWWTGGAFFAALAIGGCHQLRTDEVREGHLVGAGLEIVGENPPGRPPREFHLRHGEPFGPPFGIDLWSELDFKQLSPERLRLNYRYALTRGARSVRVVVPGRTVPLFGVLVLNRFPRVAIDAGHRSYRIHVSDDVLESIAGGQVGVTYGRLDLEQTIHGRTWWYAWVLWLREEPFFSPGEQQPSWTRDR